MGGSNELKKITRGLCGGSVIDFLSDLSGSGEKLEFSFPQYQYFLHPGIWRYTRERYKSLYGYFRRFPRVVLIEYLLC